MGDLSSRSNNISICAAAVANTNSNVVITANSNHNVNNLSNIPITCTTSSTTVNTNSSEDTEMRHRFKVVKLVSSQPYTRGKWTCFDYNDENQNTINISKSVPANKILPNGHPDNSTSNNDQNSNTVANNACSDQSGVAIDNKIEQAMDLVKSHLMFAVREEVDVLKERIKELESDIQILKAHAAPETLALLGNRATSANTNVE